MRVLVAEDDPGLRSVLARGLREHGYVVDAVVDGTDALAYLRSYVYEVVVLDWRMPKQSGMDVLNAMRSHGDHTPVLMLTARDAIEDRVAGLNQGADDYLVKPFSFSELVARISALQRRPALTLDPVLTCGDLVFDPTTRVLTRDADPVALTSIETGLVELLMRRAPAVVSRRTIALQVWDDEADAVGSNTIEVHIGRLRAKLAGAAAHIETVRGIGYRMVG
ncbi:MAG TPA: response regulator transcription factor [Acidimicrobiales bacterium]|nr:response regulator transcription factor [Acidimicrobiales bacterium]